MNENEQSTTALTEEPQADRVPAARKTYARALLNIAVFWGISVVLQLLFKKLLPQDAPKIFSVILNFAPMYFIAFPIYLFLSKSLPASPPEKHKMHIGQILLAFPCCEFIGIAGNLIGTIINLILFLILGQRTDSTMLLEGIFGEASWAFVVAAVIFAPIVEELMFRKILIDRTRKYGELPAILISGVMFGLFHGNFTQFFYACGLGLLFAWIYVRTGKVIHTIVLHCMVNFWGSALPLILLHGIDKDVIKEMLVNQNYSVMLENIGQFVPFMLLIVVNWCLALAGLILLIVNRQRIKLQPAEEELPKNKRFPAAVFNYGFLILFAVCAAEFVLQIVTKK